MTEKIASAQKAVIVVDMQNDNIGRYSRDIIPNIKLLIDKAREKGIPVIFACDSRYPDDFLFTRLGHPVGAIRGTEGAKVIAELDKQPMDVLVEKRMLSGFFQSDLDFTLRQKGSKLLIVTGVSTAGCVLKTVMDAHELGYEVIVPQDCCAAPNMESHQWALQYYERYKMLAPTVREVIKTL